MVKSDIGKELRRMIDIYTEKIDSKDWILQNDLYFNLNTSNEEMSQKEVDLIRQIDGAKLTPDKHIETKYGIGTIRNLSSGCSHFLMKERTIWFYTLFILLLFFYKLLLIYSSSGFVKSERLIS